MLQQERGMTLNKTHPFIIFITEMLIVHKIVCHVPLYVQRDGNLWSVTLKQEYKLQLFENTQLRKIFRPNRDKMGN